MSTYTIIPKSDNQYIKMIAGPYKSIVPIMTLLRDFDFVLETTDNEISIYSASREVYENGVLMVQENPHLVAIVRCEQ